MNESCELQIILGRNCNISCKHCLNSSGPGIKSKDLTDSDILEVTRTINSFSNISMVSFSGGEPFLYLKKIEKIQSLVTRQINWSITTNLSLYSSKAHRENFLKLNFDSITVSLDIYRLEFLNLDDLINNINEVSLRVKKIFLNVVYENEIDIEEIVLKIPHLKNMKLNLTKVIASGKHKKTIISDINSRSEFDFSCPNFKQDRIKVSYYAGEGYSICCGPRVFNYENAERSDQSIFFNNIDEFSANEFNKSLRNKSDISILNKFNEQDNFSTDCDFCFSGYDRLINTTPKNIKSIDNIFIPAKNTLSKFMDDRLSKNFHVQYLCYAKLGLVEPTFKDESCNVTNVFLHNDDHKEDLINQFRDFTIQNFYQPNSAHYSFSEQQFFLEVSKIYFAGEVKSLFSYKNQKLVGCVTLYKYKTHPFFKTPAWHIGYWGYERCLVGKTEAQYIKNSWYGFINSIISEDNSPVVGVVDSFNSNVLKLISKWGFTIEAIRCDLKKP